MEYPSGCFPVSHTGINKIYLRMGDEINGWLSICAMPHSSLSSYPLCGLKCSCGLGTH